MIDRVDLILYLAFKKVLKNGSKKGKFLKNKALKNTKNAILSKEA